MDERKRTGIPSPRGGSTQGIGKRLWRLIEVLDKRKAGLPLDEVEHSLCSKAGTLWKSVKHPPPPYNPIFYVRVALRDILKHGDRKSVV